MSSKTKIAIALIGAAALGYFVVMPVLKKTSGL